MNTKASTKNSGYDVTVHAASLDNTALYNAIQTAPESAIGSPLYNALIAEWDRRRF